MFAEDLSAFFDTINGFAEPVIYDGTPNIAMIFDAAFFEDRAGAAGIESTQPIALARDADVAGVVHGKIVVRGSATYKIVEVHPDGSGLTLLVLQKQ